MSTVNLISQDIGRQLGVKKCGVVTMKRGRLAKAQILNLVVVTKSERLVIRDISIWVFWG